MGQMDHFPYSKVHFDLYSQGLKPEVGFFRKTKIIRINVVRKRMNFLKGHPMESKSE